jgi:hypothetical protein
MSGNEQIFILIPSFNEDHLRLTVEGAIATAEKPDNLSFGICQQSTTGQFEDFRNLKNVRVTNVFCDSPRGADLARVMAGALHDHEPYMLRLDAHHLFDNGWDRILLDKHRKLEESDPKTRPLITQYLPRYGLYDGEINVIDSPDNGSAPTMAMYDRPETFIAWMPMYGYGEPVRGEWQEHHCLSNHFIFSRSEFFWEIMPDPAIMFEGDEPCLAVRSWTRGYRMYAIPEMIVWHRAKFPDIPDGDDDIAGQIAMMNGRLDELDWRHIDEYNNRRRRLSGKLRTQRILTGQYLGEWGAPSMNLLKRYYQAANFDIQEFYKKLETHQKESYGYDFSETVGLTPRV